jgi:hypothetical protein
MMKSAHIQTSQRLQRVDALLADGQEYSTLDIIQYASVCAVNSIIAELRDNGRDIQCRRTGNTWLYKRVDVNF